MDHSYGYDPEGQVHQGATSSACTTPADTSLPLQGMPLQCSVFMTRHAGILKQTNASGAAYLFQPDKLNAEYDLGDKTIQCGRRPDAYKLWLAWKVHDWSALLLSMTD